MHCLVKDKKEFLGMHPKWNRKQMHKRLFMKNNESEQNTNLPEDEICTDSLRHSFICPGVPVELQTQQMHDTKSQDLIALVEDKGGGGAGKNL